MIVGFSTCGCYFFAKTTAPMPSSISGLDLETQRLVLLFPGLGDRMGKFEKEGFQKLARDYPSVFDQAAFVELDAHFRYYPSGQLMERIEQDVLKRFPDKKITVVGTSLGGFGAQIIARHFPDRVDQLILIAPYMGDGKLIRRVAEVGTELRPDDSPKAQQTLKNWAFLIQAAEVGHPRVDVLVGNEDKLRRGIEILKSKAPQIPILELPGGHKWDVWMALWETWLKLEADRQEDRSLLPDGTRF